MSEKFQASSSSTSRPEVQMVASFEYLTVVTSAWPVPGRRLTSWQAGEATAAATAAGVEPSWP